MGKLVTVFALVALAGYFWRVDANSSIFLPYGLNNGDQVFKDDVILATNTSKKILFYDKIYKTVYFKRKGVIYFKEGEENDFSIFFSSNTVKNFTFLRESSEASLLEKLDDILNNKTSIYNSFKSSWSFIITVAAPFENMFCFGRNACEPTVLYQVVYTTDGVKSLVLFMHNKTVLDLQQIGVKHGNDKTIINSSQIYLTDDTIVLNVNDKCSKDMNQINGKLLVSPESVLYYGQQDVTFEGHCFDDGTKEVDITIDNTTIKCSVEMNYRIKCITPYFDKFGEVSVYLNDRWFNYTGILNVRDIATEKEFYFFSDNIDLLTGQIILPVDNPLKMFRSGLLRGVQQNIYHNTADDTYKVKNYNIHKQMLVFLDKTEYFPMKYVDHDDPIPDMVRILLNYEEYAFEIFLSKKSVGIQSMCSFWKLKVPKIAQNQRKIWLHRISSHKCPNHINEKSLLTPECSLSKPKSCQIFNPGSQQCTFQEISDVLPLKCCYDKNGTLVENAENQSTQKIFYNSGIFNHFWNVIRPHLFCCEFSNECDKLKY